jgi:hypothetical protein
MVDPKATLVRAWMSKAQSDLGTARKLASGPEAYPLANRADNDQQTAAL